MLCSEMTLVNDGGTEGAYSVMRCKRWSCSNCQPYNRMMVIRAGRRGNPNTFITLTCNPMNYDTPDEAAADMKRAWVLIRRHIKEKYGIINLPFLAVFERTKQGWPHMHILCRASWIDQAWLSDQLRGLTGAYIVDIRRITDQGKAAWYVSKYVGKDPFAFLGCKRWWRSHNYEMEPEEKRPFVMFGDYYSTTSEPFDHLVAKLKREGAIIEEETPNYIRFSRYPWLKKESRACGPGAPPSDRL